MNLKKEVYLTQQELSYSQEENKLLSLFRGYEWCFKILSENNAFIVGGVLTSIFTNQVVNDIDVYFSCSEDLEKCQKDLEYYRKPVLSKNAVNFRNILPVPLQLITKIIKPTIEDIFNEFDFTVCMAGFSCKEREFVFHYDFFKHLAQRELVFNVKSKNPVHALLRVEKYKKRGYTFKQKELYKIIGNIIAMKVNTNEEMISLIEGMYGSETRKIVKELKDPLLIKEPFDLGKFIDILNNSYREEELHMSPSPVLVDDLPF